MPDSKTRRTRRRALILSLAALAGCLALGALLAREHARLLADDREDQLARVAERTVDGLHQQLRTCGVVIRAMQSFFLGSENVAPEEFRRVYESLDPKVEFPSLIAFAFARRVEGAGPGGGVRYPTEMVAPAAGNERLVGLDVATQPANLRAAEASRDSNLPAMSGSFRLIQFSDSKDTVDGITLRLPVYSTGDVPHTLEERRARFVGTLGVSFRVRALIDLSLPPEVGRDMEVRVSDVTDAPPKELYFSGDRARWQQPAGLGYSGEVRYGGRVWRIELRPVAGWGGATQWLPWLTFLIAAAASILLASLIWVLANRRERALEIAQELSSRFRESEERFRSLNELLPVAVALSRVDSGVITYVNQLGRRLLDLPRNQTAGRTLPSLFEDELLSHRIATADAGLVLDAFNTRLHDGKWAQVSIAPLAFGGEPHRLAVISDVTEFRELTDRLSYQASRDALTNLFNRREFERRLEAAIAMLDDEGTSSALLYLDLDQFKLINDTSGHMAGDVLLEHLASRLTAEMSARHVLARLGGDEFGVLLCDVDEAQALRSAEQIRIAVDDFIFSWEGKTYSITVSIGIVMIMRGGARSLRELLSLADTACYMAKERGRNRVHLYSETDLDTTRRRGEMEWVNRLKRAIIEQRLRLYYQEIQPLQPARDGEGAHFELLIRMVDEQGALVPPGAFIPAAERYNLMPALDRWVVQHALSNFAWLHPQGKQVALCAINLSGNTLEDEDFPAFVLSQLERTGVAPERVCFEITETAAVGSMARVVQFMQRLRALGCRFALDDFGAGMSSFGYLKNLPVDYIKIDGSFIREIEGDAMSYSIVRAVTDIGHQAGAAVVAEFVANPRQCELLRGLGVDYAQGFSIHVPEPAGSAPAR
jgi:diguanylate cyclase (GGDEF)-like protein/PAS domain S-box-containing protein